VLSDEDGEFLALRLVDPVTHQARRITPELGWDVEEFDASPDGRYLAYVDSWLCGFGVRHELFLADLQSGRRRKIAELDVAEHVPWSRDSRHVYFANPEGDAPMHVRVVDPDQLFGRR